MTVALRRAYIRQVDACALLAVCEGSTLGLVASADQAPRTCYLLKAIRELQARIRPAACEWFSLSGGLTYPQIREYLLGRSQTCRARG